ncbi:acetoin utilization protein [Allostella sp. ATCC 35155]|nr:acetoin utilization protein [Stella sp. ATCC 35155]
MTTRLYTHPACIAHDTGPYHPERPARLQAVLEALEAPEFAALERHEAPEVEMDDLRRVHPQAHIDAVLAAIPAEGRRNIDPDTVVSLGSREAALRAAGAVTAAVDAVMAGAAANAFCAVRPPGHHAEPDRAMGFCLFNNVAVGALRAHQVHGCERVAVIDFDVHHGNGTQAMFAPDARLFYASTHQWPFYPGTGARDERGAAGNIVNAPLGPNAGSADFRFVVAEFVLPALEEFRPDFLLISAGFDAHNRDPLAALNLFEEDFAWVTDKLTGLAARHCAGRVVSVLEGGYDLEALASSSAAHVQRLMAAG